MVDAEAGIDKSAFITLYGLYNFLRMPFNLKYFGSTSVCEMSKILASLDDTNSYSSHLLRIWAIEDAYIGTRKTVLASSTC